MDDHVGTGLGLEMSGKAAVEFKRKLEDKAETVPFATTYPVLVLSDPLLPVLHGCKELFARLVALEMTVLPTVLLLLVLPARIDDEELRPELVVRRVVVLLVVNTPVCPSNITEPLTRRS